MPRGFGSMRAIWVLASDVAQTWGRVILEMRIGMDWIAC
jgi:hypothetical protein